LVSRFSSEVSFIDFISDALVYCVRFVLRCVRGVNENLALLSSGFGSKRKLPKTYFGGSFLVDQIIFISTNKG
jgi:hypothetical protein